MRDPFEAFETIRDFYITYLETAFRIRHDSVQRARRLLLEAPGTLCAEPFVEPVPRYLGPDESVRIDRLADDRVAAQWLPGFETDARRAFIRAAMAGLLPSERDPNSGAMRGSYGLYQHQLEMLRKGVGVGTPGIVASGTGSGKTEAFLLPILATIVREARSWPAPDFTRWQPWWQASTPGDRSLHFRRDFEHRARPKAVRALILYPMNALVEDQMVRLRKTLDSDEVHGVLDEEIGGNRIFFGRYTSATPVTGWLRHPRRAGERDEAQKAMRRIAELRKWVLAADATQTEARKQADRDDEPDLAFNFPRVDGAEMLGRWEMQRHPPDILITNTSMLSTMLAREIEEPIWDGTRDWLANDPDAYFFLVVDELHLQRGTAGTEVGFLLRLLLTRLGLDRSEHRHKLRVLASSASLPVEGSEGERSLDYLWSFFGSNGLGSTGSRERWEEAIITGRTAVREAEPLRSPDADRVVVSIEGLSAMSDHGRILRCIEAPDRWRDLAEALRVDRPPADAESVERVIVERATALLESACVRDDEMRATSVDRMSRTLFGDVANARRALECLFLLRGHAESVGGGLDKDLSSFRVHWFLRAIEGLFAAPHPVGPTANREARIAAFFGDLSVERGLRLGASIDEGRRPRFFELLYCECCG